MPRKLRIAVSVFFGLLTVALMAMFVRSYCQEESNLIPYWLVAILASSSMTTLPWNRVQFSVRGLLVVTTLVAVVLGLAVWAGR